MSPPRTVVEKAGHSALEMTMNVPGGRLMIAVGVSVGDSHPCSGDPFAGGCVGTHKSPGPWRVDPTWLR